MAPVPSTTPETETALDKASSDADDLTQAYKELTGELSADDLKEVRQAAGAIQNELNKSGKYKGGSALVIVVIVLVVVAAGAAVVAIRVKKSKQ